MLLIDPQRSWIEAGEPEVVAVYRSRGAVPLGGAGHELPPVEAYVCLLRGAAEPEVHLGFFLQGVRRGVVGQVVVERRWAGDDPLTEALRMLDDLGFSIEGVNLKFSRALREVVLRDLPALQPPAVARQAAAQRQQLLAELEQQASVTVDEAPGEEAAAGLSLDRQAAARRARQDRRELAQKAARKLAAERLVDEQLEALRGLLTRILTGDRPSAPAEPQFSSRPVVSVGSSAPTAEPEVGEAPAGLLAPAEEEVATPAPSESAAKTPDDELRAQLLASEAERSSLATENGILQRQLEELVGVQRQDGERLTAAVAERERLQQQLESALQEGATAAGERARLQDELKEALAAGERSAEAEIARQELAAQRETMARQLAEREEAFRRLTREVEAGRAALQTMTSEKAAIEKRLARESSARKRLEREKVELEHRIGELTAALEQAEGKSAAASQGADRAGRLTAEKEALARRIEELAATAKAATERAAAEQRERERLKAELVALERRQAAQRDSGSRAEERRASPPATTPPATPPLPPVPRPPLPGAYFHVSLELAEIPCDAATAVIEIHQGLCMAQLSLEGFPAQFCSGYVVGLKKGRGRQVFVAFRLSSTGRNLVYAPERQPQNQSDYARALKEAFKFLQVIGMDTEPLALPDAAEARTRELTGIPVLALPTGA